MGVEAVQEGTQQPCGVPVLSGEVEERWGPSLTALGLQVRKFLIRAHVRRGRPRVNSFVTRMSEFIGQNAKL